MITNIPKKGTRKDRKKASVMSKVPVSKRSAKGVRIIRRKLEELGFTCIKQEKRCEDFIAVKGNCKIPIQAKPLPLTRSNNQTSASKSAIETFAGLYVVWVELGNKPDAFLFIPDQLFYAIARKQNYAYNSVGKVRPHKNRWQVYVSRRLKGFEIFADDTIPDRYCRDKETLLKELKH